MMNSTLRPIGYGVLILIGVNLFTFLLFFTVNTPDDMARLNIGGKRVTQEAIDKWKVERGYDKPLLFNGKDEGARQFTNTILFERLVQLFAFEFGASDSGRDIGYEICERILKGVALALCPDATIVDISHDIPPHDILTGALELAACYRFFPAGTIFLVVVDPGVGSARLGIAAEAGDYRFVAPDNGVLTAVFAETPPKRVVSLTERRYARPTISKTFEGRDRFAPAAAWLVRGAEVKALGTAVRDYVRLDIPQPQQEGDRIAGAVLRVDRFGNLVTNIPRAMGERLAARGPIRITQL